MRALTRTLAATAVAMILLSPRPTTAQTSEEIQAQTRAIQAEIRAVRAADADRRWIREEVATLRRQILGIDTCLAAGNQGYLVFKTPGGCNVMTYKDIDTQIFILGLTHEMTETEIYTRLRTMKRDSDASLAAMREQRETLAGELNRANYRLASVVNPPRGDYPAVSSGAGCALPASWNNVVAGIGSSTWAIAADGHAQESGMGNATGSATFSGQTLTITWATANGYAGQYIVRFDAGCNHGVGYATQTRSPLGYLARNGDVTFSR